MAFWLITKKNPNKLRVQAFDERNLIQKISRRDKKIGNGYPSGQKGYLLNGILMGVPVENLPLKRNVFSFSQKPIQIFGKPIQIFGKPIQIFGKPIQIFGKPIQIFGKPIQIFGKPIQIFGKRLPNRTEGLHPDSEGLVDSETEYDFV